MDDDCAPVVGLLPPSIVGINYNYFFGCLSDDEYDDDDDRPASQHTDVVVDKPSVMKTEPTEPTGTPLLPVDLPLPAGMSSLPVGLPLIPAGNTADNGKTTSLKRKAGRPKKTDDADNDAIPTVPTGDDDDDSDCSDEWTPDVRTANRRTTTKRRRRPSKAETAAAVLTSMATDVITTPTMFSDSSAVLASVPASTVRIDYKNDCACHPAVPLTTDDSYKFADEKNRADYVRGVLRSEIVDLRARIQTGCPAVRDPRAGIRFLHQRLAAFRFTVASRTLSAVSLALPRSVSLRTDEKVLVPHPFRLHINKPVTQTIFIACRVGVVGNNDRVIRFAVKFNLGGPKKKVSKVMAGPSICCARFTADGYDFYHPTDDDDENDQQPAASAALASASGSPSSVPSVDRPFVRVRAETGYVRSDIGGEVRHAAIPKPTTTSTQTVDAERKQPPTQKMISKAGHHAGRPLKCHLVCVAGIDLLLTVCCLFCCGLVLT